MPGAEGFTPTVLWTTLYGFVSLCILFIAIYKVYDAIHTIMDRRRRRIESERPDFAEEVSQKVIDKLEPRFAEIERNLARDKTRLDGHDTMLAEARSAQQETREGLVAICKYLMAMTQFGNVGGGSKEMKDATAELSLYLATRIGGNSK